jgi:hypothetical protein
MRELIEYLVAYRGAEEAVARMAAGIHQQFLCVSGSPITAVYAREKFVHDSAEETAGATSGFGLLDRGSQMCRVTGTGAGRT